MASRVAIACVVIFAILITLLALWHLLDVFLLAFAGLLLAILLRTLAAGLADVSPLSEGWSFFVVVAGLCGLCAAAGWILVPHVLDQWPILTDQIPQSVDQLESRLRNYRWGQELLQAISNRSDEWSKTLNLFRLSRNVFTQTAGVITSVFVLVFVSLYLAYDPRGHREAVILLLPPSLRKQAAECVQAMIDVLKWWLVGKGLSMALVGVLTWVGLWALGIPLATTLALIAFLLAFIPNFGPILSLVPAVLVASSQGMSMAGYVVLLYLAIQTIESYLITPLIQKRSVALPPAIIILGQVVMGVLAGALGVALATPLLASLNACLRNLYAHNLHDESTGSDRKLTDSNFGKKYPE